MENCDIGNETVKYLSDNRNLKNLKELDISNNPKMNARQLFEDMENHKLFSGLEKLYVANLGMDVNMIREVQEEFKIKVYAEPHVFKDYSDYLHHIKTGPAVDNKTDIDEHGVDTKSFDA